MRSMSATSAAAAAAADIMPATRPRRAPRSILRAEPRDELGERRVPDLAETDVALLRGEVARAKHRPVPIPVGDETVDERAGRSSPSSPSHGSSSRRASGRTSSPTSAASASTASSTSRKYW